MGATGSFSLESLTTYKEGLRLEVKSAKGGLPNSFGQHIPLSQTVTAV